MKQLLGKVSNWFRNTFATIDWEPGAVASEDFFRDVKVKELYSGVCGNGKVVLPHPDMPGPVVVHGGPYRMKPSQLSGIRLEKSAPADETMLMSFPIVDFGVPEYEVFEDAVEKAYEILLDERELYIGCTGGFGRTGLFAACLIAKVMHDCGVPFSYGKDATAYLRANYVPNAVETREQQAMVDQYVEGLLNQ